MLVHAERPSPVKCQICDKDALGGWETYSANGVTVDHVAVYRCVHCDHQWLPLTEEHRIDKIVAEARK